MPMETPEELQTRLLALARALGLTITDDSIRGVAATMADALAAVRAAARDLGPEGQPASRPVLNDESCPPSA